MPRVDVVKTASINRSARVMQVESMFDVPPSQRAEARWELEVPLEEKDWNVGLIVGPSGAGKSTVARQLFGDSLVEGFEWPEDAALVDGFGEDVGIKTITKSLTSVGLGTVPAWLRPYETLSTGERFRATVARALAEAPDPIVIDEFTSVVDRQVAKVGSHAVAKAARRDGRQFVAVSCHYDIVDWLQPDWILEPHTGRFQWRYLQRRPGIDLRIYRIRRSLWSVFGKYHYMSAALHRGAQCFGGFVDGRCVAFHAYIHFPHPKVKNLKQVHRTVVLPEWQGLGLGGILTEWTGQRLWNQGYRYRTILAHPAMIAYHNRSPRWICKRLPSRQSKGGNTTEKALQRRFILSARRQTVSFEFSPPSSQPAS